MIKKMMFTFFIATEVILISCNKDDSSVNPISNESVVVWGSTQIANFEAKLRETDPEALEYLSLATNASNMFIEASPDPQVAIRQANKIGDEEIGIEEVTFYRQLAQAFAIDYRFNGHIEALHKSQEFILAWVDTYNLDLPNSGLFTSVFHLLPFINAYELVRDEMTINEQEKVNAFFRKLYEQADHHINNDKHVRPYGNHWSYHTASITSIGFILNDQEIIAHAERLFKEQIDWNLFPGGTPRNFYKNAPKGAVLIEFLEECGMNDNIYEKATLDWFHRDALGYHIISTTRLLTAGLIARNNGMDWLSYTGQQGMKLEDGFELLKQYTNTFHEEYINSCLDEDRQKKPWIVQPDDIIRTLASASLISNNYNQWADSEYGSFTEIFEITTE